MKEREGAVTETQRKHMMEVFYLMKAVVFGSNSHSKYTRREPRKYIPQPHTSNALQSDIDSNWLNPTISQRSNRGRCNLYMSSIKVCLRGIRSVWIQRYNHKLCSIANAYFLNTYFT